MHEKFGCRGNRIYIHSKSMKTLRKVVSPNLDNSMLYKINNQPQKKINNVGHSVCSVVKGVKRAQEPKILSYTKFYMRIILE